MAFSHNYFTRSKKHFSNFKSTTVFKNNSTNHLQLNNYYKYSDPDIIELVQMTPHYFGIFVEKIVKELLELEPRINSQHDATLNNTKIEIKSSRFWNKQSDFKWQHIEPEHDWDILLCVSLTQYGLNIEAITKDQVIYFIKNNCIHQQGNQGFWVWSKDIYLTPIKSKSDLIKFIQLFC